MYALYVFVISLKNNSLRDAMSSEDLILMMICSIGLFSLCLNFKNKNIISKMIVNIGQNTLGIYIIHSFIIRIGRLIFNESLFLGRIGILIFTLIVSYTLTIGVKKIPLVKELVNL